jgi:hypothetical protein
MSDLEMFLKYRMIDQVQKKSIIMSFVHHHQNPLECATSLAYETEIISVKISTL